MSFKTKIRYLFRHTSLLTAFECSLSVGFSYYLGKFFSAFYYFPLEDVAGLWSAISAIIVLNIGTRATVKAASFRMLGSLFGGLIACLINSFFGYSLLSLFAGIFLTIIVATLFHLKKIFRLSSLTLSIVTIVGIASPGIPVLTNALSRIFESLLGSVITIIVVMIFYPLRRYLKLHKTKEEIWRWFS